jgi:hypothetical protein
MFGIHVGETKAGQQTGTDSWPFRCPSASGPHPADFPKPSGLALFLRSFLYDFYGSSFATSQRFISSKAFAHLFGLRLSLPSSNACSLLTTTAPPAPAFTSTPWLAATAS